MCYAARKCLGSTLVVVLQLDQRRSLRPTQPTTGGVSEAWVQEIVADTRGARITVSVVHWVRGRDKVESACSGCCRCQRGSPAHGKVTESTEKGYGSPDRMPFSFAP